MDARRQREHESDDYQERRFNGTWYWRERQSGDWMRFTPEMLLAKLNADLSHAKH